MKRLHSLSPIVMGLLLIVFFGAFQGNSQTIRKVSSLPTTCTPVVSPIYQVTATPFGLWECIATDTYRSVGASTIASNGSLLTLKTNRTTVAGAAAATVSATGAIPAASLVVGVTVRVTTTFSNTSLTSQNIGDGTTADLFGATVALTAGTTTTYANHKSTFTNKVYVNATDIVFTGVGASYTTNGVAEVIVYYYSITAPTS